MIRQLFTALNLIYVKAYMLNSTPKLYLASFLRVQLWFEQSTFALQKSLFLMIETSMWVLSISCEYRKDVIQSLLPGNSKVFWISLKFKEKIDFFIFQGFRETPQGLVPMEWTQDHKHSARGRFSTILRIFEGIFQKKIFHSMIMSNLALLDMLKTSLCGTRMSKLTKNAKHIQSYSDVSNLLQSQFLTLKYFFQET